MKRKRPPSAPIGSRTAACLLILYSFLSLGVRTTPDHKSGRAHLQNVASRGAKLKFWKIEFLQLFHSKSGALYVKTPHFRAAFSVLHLSSTHFGASDLTRTGDLLITRETLPVLHRFTDVLIVTKSREIPMFLLSECSYFHTSFFCVSLRFNDLLNKCWTRGSLQFDQIKPPPKWLSQI